MRPYLLIPQIALAGDLRIDIEQASLALGRLDALSMRPTDFLPPATLLQRKEALLSAQIDGSRGSLGDLLASEAGVRPGDHLGEFRALTRRVSCHMAALDWGLLQIRNGFPLSTRLLRAVYAKHADLPTAPPASEQTTEAMADLERFLNDVPARTPPLIKAAIAHAQLAAIAPFPDNNGPMGRLLVPLMFCADSVLREPVLCLSMYLKPHRQPYHDLLATVRETGEWESWLAFFARGVAETATHAARMMEELGQRVRVDRERVLAAGRPTKSILRVLDALRTHPVDTAPRLAERTELTLPTVIAALERLQALGIIEEITGKRRNRTYRYSAYIQRLGEGTESA